MSRGRIADPHAGLLRHLKMRLAYEGMAAELETSRSVRWASATFTGARHHFHFATGALDDSRSIARLAATLAETDFGIADHIVADIAMTPAAHGFDVEALTVEAR